MKPLFFLAASILALTTVACSPKAPPARAALDCPSREGDLTRTAAAPDGKACTYTSDDGAEVTLQLVSLQGAGPDMALSTIETTLLANRRPSDASNDASAKSPETAGAEDASEKASASGAADVDRARAEALADSRDAGVKVDARIGDSGKTVSTTDSGGTTRVSLPGIRIVANDRDDTANVKVGPITVNAGDNGLTVRTRRDVRLRGEALNPDKRGVRATFIYTGEDLPDGYRFVGYEAGGPKAGPITVAVVKSKSEGPDGGDLYPDVKKLVRKNGGV